MQFIKKIDISNFNTEKLNDISYMFFKCFSLEKIYFSKIEINKIIMKNMFYGCNNLKEIIIKNNTNNINNNLLI